MAFAIQPARSRITGNERAAIYLDVDSHRNCVRLTRLICIVMVKFIETIQPSISDTPFALNATAFRSDSRTGKFRKWVASAPR